jgi:hypothetical protein
MDPDEPASIEMVDGDGGSPIVKGGKTQFLGKTYREIFESRLRVATFNSTDKPNHIFLAVLTAEQIDYPGSDGWKWLKILKENGFEFIRTTDNSVYSGSGVISTPGQDSGSPHENYLFGLFRNIGYGAVKDPFTPPKAWTDLPNVVPEAWETLPGENLAVLQQAAQLELWNKSSKATMYTEEELVAAGVPVTLAGRRSKQPQQLKSRRVAVADAKPVSSTSPFGKPSQIASVPVPEPVYDADYDDEEDCYCDDCE